MNRYIDVSPARCIGCRACEIACALAHPDDRADDRIDESVALQAAQRGQNEVFAYLGRRPRLTVVKDEETCMPVTCHHCDDAPCATVCPTAAISHVRGTVQVNQERCIGCKSCMLACPYGMMQVVTVPVLQTYSGMRLSLAVKAQAHKCDLCVDYAVGPACVSACPTQALHVFTPEDALQTVQQRRMQAFSEKVGAARAA